MADLAPAIAVRDLEVRFGEVQALASVSFDFSGASLGLLGPNGAGKSTLIKTLLGLIRADAGEARVLGRDCRREAIEIRRRVGYVPERDCHIPGMIAVDYVTLGGELAGMPREAAIERAHEMIRFCGLGEARYRPVDGYSAGMRQRIKLAQALVHDPDLILLDEPTNGLDPEGRLVFLDVLRELHRRKGIRIVLSSHLLRDVEYVCDEVVVMRAGKVVRHEGIEDLKAMSDRNWLVRVRGDEARFLVALAEQGCQHQRSGKDLLAVDTPAPGSGPIVAAAAAAEVQLRHLAKREISFEDAIMTTLQEGEA
ncbi:MAG: ABC transporter ATP-binding protein [Planctomycetes bacterium]|nr:ABC transporter ATP-binding protein [Planctomycetota bacterium]